MEITGKVVFCCVLVCLTLIVPTSCAENRDTSKNCGKGPSSINGPGLLDAEGDFPWTAQVSIREETVADETYPAVLLTPSLVLTSAHYLFGKNTHRFQLFNISAYFVTVGTRIFGDPAQTRDESAIYLGLSHIQIHPNFVAGDWFTRQNDYALFHLEAPIELNDRVQPICIPSSDDFALITQLKSPTLSKSKGEVVLVGWNRGSGNNSVTFLRLKTQTSEECENRWKGNDETQPYPSLNKWCALVGQQNNHSLCIHRDIGGVRLVNGSYYLGSIVDNFYSINRTCVPGALYYFRDLERSTLRWIERNIRCGSHQFTCANGNCIPLSGVCDKTWNCTDGSDEDPQFCRGLNFCNEDEFSCGTYGPCIPKEQENDGVKDCDDGEDELGYKPPQVPVPPVPIFKIVTGLILAFFGIAAIILFFWRRHVQLLKRTIRDLTQDEMKEFLKGYTIGKSSLKRKATLPRPFANDPVQALPWREEFNISPNDIMIGEELGRGNSGIVYKGILTQGMTKEGSNSKVWEVAVKRNLDSVAVHEFRAILCELKILAYVGEHANVVKFYGACTQNIKRREVLLVVEYCSNGSLRDFLLKNRPYFGGSGTHLGSEYRYDNLQYGCLDMYDLLLWSTQIAAGMEYLTSQGVVHGDLAARNVLLSSHLDAKITDFGLSHQLGGSRVYIKSADDPVPFKWLAIETLESNTLSEKSDVWGFGITLWEIFTLGGTPYESIGWSDTFLKDLVAGLRLTKPVHATDEIYDLMSQCWGKCPMDRPTFAGLREHLTIILHRYGPSPKRSRESKETDLEYFKVVEQ